MKGGGEKGGKGEDEDTSMSTRSITLYLLVHVSKIFLPIDSYQIRSTTSRGQSLAQSRGSTTADFGP